jgi:hypothetical protein
MQEGLGVDKEITWKETELKTQSTWYESFGTHENKMFLVGEKASSSISQKILNLCCGTRNWRFYWGMSSPQNCFKKMTKHEKTYFDNQHVFILFIFDTFDFLAPKIENLLKIVQKIVHSNVVSPRFMNIFLQRLSFAIQKN